MSNDEIENKIIKDKKKLNLNRANMLNQLSGSWDHDHLVKRRYEEIRCKVSNHKKIKKQNK
jgi:hypothetical protein